jgi:2-polyprenyl-3-methyl-5-hydroxy-6-metoxy-1,4-benzoquinol methylase
MSADFWDERYAADHYIFGTAPNVFLASQAALIRPGLRALAIADGEGRNGVWLAEQGVRVHAIDFSAAALEKARKLAAERGVELEIEQADVLAWAWPEAAYDLVVAIFIQFAPPPERERIIAGIRRTLKPGGTLILQGYTPKQIEYGTGGPPAPPTCTPPNCCMTGSATGTSGIYANTNPSSAKARTITASRR